MILQKYMLLCIPFHYQINFHVLILFQEFDEAIQSAINFSNNNKNTLIIVTADHETGGLAITGGKVRRFTMRTKWGTIGHTAEMVPVFSTGPKSETFSGIYDNTDIFKKILNAIEN